MLRIYTYSKCDTCRRALRFLRERNVVFEEISIRDTPPSDGELKEMATAYRGIRKLFNTSGSDYKALKLSEALPGMSERDVLELLSKNGNLVKRPFLIGESVRLVGFKLPEWEASVRRRKKDDNLVVVEAVVPTACRQALGTRASTSGASLSG